jgi:TorA maturation chaperone TorD
MMVMTNGEKERFCSFAASIIAPPDGAMMDDLEQDNLRTLIGEYVRQWGGARQLPSLFVKEGNREDRLSALQGEYERLFGQWEGKRISLVESTYKTWTTDKGCQMVFAASKGLIMGDHALHMQELYRHASLEIPEDEAIERFIGDHLDWIPELKSALEKGDPHPFYRNAVEIIHQFLQQETKTGKVDDHGQKKIH